MNKRIFTEKSSPVFVVLERVTRKEEDLPGGVQMVVKGKGGNAGKPTTNENLYTRGLCRSMIESSGTAMDERSLFGLSDHPEKGKGASVKDISLIFTSLAMHEQTGEIFFEAHIPRTSAGNDLAALADAGAKVGISSRVHGAAKRVTITDQHPDFELCKEWEGKEVNELEDGTVLKGFDVVIDPAVSDAGITDHHEEEELMDEIKKMLEALGKATLDEESANSLIALPAVKAAFDKAVGEAVSAKTVELEKTFGEAVDLKVADYLKSDEFMKAVGEKFDLPGKPDPVTEAKCPECDATVGKNAKFCPSCGVRVTEKVVLPTPDEKDAKIEELKKALEDQRKENEGQASRLDALETDKTDAMDAAARTEAIDTALKEQPAHISEAVRADLDGTGIGAEEIAPVVERKVARLVAFMERVGGAAPKSKPLTPSDPADIDRPNETPKGEMHEERKAQAKQAARICG